MSCNQLNACNTVVQIGSPVAVQYSSATPPSPAGGTMLNGTYHVTAAVEYVTDGGTGPTGEIRFETVLKGGNNVVEIVDRQALSDGGCEQRRQNLALIFDGGTSLTAAPICPVCDGGNDCGGGTIGYTATPTAFTIFEADQGRVRVVTFSRQ